MRSMIRRQHQAAHVLADLQRNLMSLGGYVSFYAQVVGTTGAFTAAGAAPAPAQNPVCNLQGVSCAAARTGAGVYTLTFTDGGGAHPLPITEYKYSAGIIGGAGSANVQITSIVANVVTVSTFVTAAATDENFWIEIEPITG